MSAYQTQDWPASPPLSALINRVHCMDALELLALLPDASVDAIITDPPYGMGLDEWDVVVDARHFASEFERVISPNGFVAFTHQMPYALEWLVAMDESALKYKEHISWVKRQLGNCGSGLCKGHESVFIYSKGAAGFYETSGAYSDVKVPGLMFDAISTEGLQRYIDTLWSVIKTGNPNTIRNDSQRRHIAHFSSRPIGAHSRAPETTNFTNVWSFIPENSLTRNGDVINHASVKPLKMFERLIELLTAKGMVVLDPFAGSGTTALAARNTGRRFIAGDISAEYVAIAEKRLAQPYTMPMFEVQS